MCVSSRLRRVSVSVRDGVCVRSGSEREKESGSLLTAASSLSVQEVKLTALD